MHPAVFLLCWAFLTVLVQCLGATPLLVLGVLLLAVRELHVHWVKLLRRARWLLLMLWLLTAYTVPGRLVAAYPWAPSWEGYDLANLHVLRLVLTLGLLAGLLRALDQERLIAGMWSLVSLFLPAVWAERFVVRLTLVLDEIEDRDFSVKSWRGFLHVPETQGETVLRMHLTDWRMRDTWVVSALLILLTGVFW